MFMLEDRKEIYPDQMEFQKKKKKLNIYNCSK